MHGVPEHLDLSRFRGATLIQLAIGEHELQFRFHPDAYIAVEGRWELRDSTGALIDEDVELSERKAYFLHVLLSREVEDYSVSAPHSFSLRFATGHVLTVFDSEERYESFSIQPGDIYV